jgi:flagella basal body P-ring formation protein FlgA
MTSLFLIGVFRSAATLAATIFVLFGGSAVLEAQAQATVTVNPETTIEGDRITLGGISSVTGKKETAEKLNRISLGYAPNIGMSREIRREQIVLAVNAAGFSDVVLESPANVLVRRFGQDVDESALRGAVETALLSNLREQNVQAKLVRLDVLRGVQVPAGSVDLRVNVSAIRNLFAPFSVPIEIRVDGRLVRTFAVTAEVEAFASVLVAGKDLSPGTVVTDRDVRIEKVRIDRPVTAYLRDTRILRGVAAARAVRTGLPLTSDVLVLVTVIKPGDPVRIEVGTEKLRIVVNGEARAAGRIGDRIAVKNSQTGTILQAYIVEKGVVKVAF